MRMSLTDFPLIMGILNVTPDSFSDGGQFQQQDIALHHAEQMLRQGAHIIDIGGESTRPDSQPVSVQQELNRVIPIIEAIKAELPVKVSIDTSKAEVMQAAIKAGADMINDVAALRYGNSVQTAAQANVPVCLMHMQGEPKTMQHSPEYNDVVTEVKQFLLQRVKVCLDQGIAAHNIWIDMGFGFGKTLEHNLQLMNHLEQFTQLGYPVLVGVSRKSMIGRVLDKSVDQRLFGGLGLTALAISKGAKIIRTHDVAATKDVVTMVQAVMNS
ncbi:dihydropteroate synthase [Candidatus Albibeggiatoa sp. nov. NOAA]|uniref:dihydropteroate synthase n=1 Tax=Candidatus Albibeggiatoa sp. nov. NOAA TaxID=3162724 RepID=UPI00330174FF|nr:dihydropteroate synthase [Thiotrichaceae bacterium]